jgi:ATP/maltotriose-dependent transcriptional regulator MalT
VQATLLARSRLNDRLTRAAEFPIVLVIAPAGFGKSVALQDFLANSRPDAVRFDVRREQNTLLSFAHRFSEVLQGILPGATASFPALQQQILAAADPAHLVCDWFVEHFKHTEATIVVDDLHFAAADPASVSFLGELIDRTAGRIDWIVAGRSDGGLPVATWLAYGRMDVPIDQRDLRLTLDEAAAAARASRADLSPDEIESLCTLTDGWPVAFAIALRTQTQAYELRATATREMIYRYLAEQVFSRLSQPQREFLLATAVFSTFDVTIAKALGGTAEFIEELRYGVAFLTEIAPGQYRYHDLFRDYLENELLRRGENTWQDALSRGAHLLEERNDASATLALYTKAKDARSILRLIEREGFGLFERGHADALTIALEALPDKMRVKSASAVGLQATLEAARGHFELAFRDFVASIDLAAGDDLRLALVHRYAIELVRHGRDCIALLEKYTLDDGVRAALRVPLLGTLATSYVQAARLEEARASIAAALDALDATAGDDIRARLYQQAAYVYSQGLDPELARRYAALSVELALSRNLYDVAVRAYSVLYTIAYDDPGDMIACLAILEKLLDCAGKAASSQGRIYGLMASYGIEADRGNDAALDRIEGILAETPEILAISRREVLLPAMALRAAWNGDFRRACEILDDAGEPSGDERRAEHFAEAALYACAGGMRERAEAANAEALSVLARCERPTRRTLRTRLLLAFFEQTRGDVAQAHRHLSNVKRDLDPTMPRLAALASAGAVLHRAAIGQVDRTQVAAALERLRAEQFGGLARLLEAIPFPQTVAGGYASLSTTEREILGLLAAGGSTKDMAERTSRSPRTIDTHIRSICKKLSCRSRRAVVALAIGSGWVHNETL